MQSVEDESNLPEAPGSILLRCGDVPLQAGWRYANGFSRGPAVVQHSQFCERRHGRINRAPIRGGSHSKGGEERTN